MTALTALAWKTAPGRNLIPGIGTESVSSLFLFPFAMTGLLIDLRDRASRRASFSCAAACIAALSTNLSLMAAAGAVSQILLFPSRRRLSGGCLRTLLFVAACTPGDGWTACVTALAAGYTGNRGRGALALAPSIEMGCNLLVLVRTVFQSDSILTPQMVFTLITVGVTISIVRAIAALFTGRISAAFINIFAVPYGMAVVAIGLFAFASAEDSSLSAHAAASALMLDLICIWPAATAFLRIGDLIAAGGGSDRIARLGGLILFAPWLAGLFAAGACVFALLPPGVGFSMLWLLAETTLGLLPDRYASALPFIFLLFGLGGIVALFCLALLRLLMLVMCGAPRSPRMAGSVDIELPTQYPVIVCLAVSAIMSCIPGLITRFAPGFSGALSGEGAETRAIPSVITLTGPDGLSSWTPGAVIIMFAIIMAVLSFLRRKAASVSRSAPRTIFPDIAPTEETLWADGMKIQSSWLPFGEPLLWPGNDVAAAILRQLVFISPATRDYVRRRFFKILLLTLWRVKRAAAGLHIVEAYGLAAILMVAALGLWIVTIVP